MFSRLLSFVIPITRKIRSDHNGCLEVTLVNGRKVLNTLNTNYSYGSLQRVLRYSLEQLELSHTSNILVLGLGGGCVLKTLRNDFNYSGKITAVDIDPVIIQVAEKEFDIVPDPNTVIICQDAIDFVKTHGRKFDLVIVDLFIDNKVPDKFLAPEFWRDVLKKMIFPGSIVFNTLCIPFTNLQPIEDKFRLRGFTYEVHRHVQNTNKVLIANHT